MAVIKIKSAVTRIKRRLVNKGFEVRGCVGGRRVKGVTWGYVPIYSIWRNGKCIEERVHLIDYGRKLGIIGENEEIQL